MLLGTSDAGLLGNLLTGTGTIKLVRIFNAASSFKNFLYQKVLSKST